MTSPSVPSNAYTDEPELHSNLLLGSLQLLCWLLFHPSAWRNYAIRIDPALRSGFTLAELSRIQWRNPALRRLLIMGYLLWPLLVGLLVGLVLWLLHLPGENIGYGMAVGVGCSVAIGVVGGVGVSTAGSLATGVVGGVAGGIAHGIMGTVEVTTTLEVTEFARRVTGGATGGIVVDVGYWAILLSGSLAGSVIGSVANQRTADSLARQMSSVIIGVLIGAITLSITVGAAIFAGYWAIGIAVGAIVSVIVIWQTHNWWRGIFLGAVLGTSGMLGTAVDVANSTVEAGGAVAVAAGLVHAIAHGIVEGTFFTALFALPYVMTEQIAGPSVGAVAGALGSGGVYMSFALFTTTSYSSWLNLLFGLTIILVGLNLTLWRPLVLYPFIVAWNTLLHHIDERRVRHPSLLRWNSAFWDEFQRLPLLGLDAHLILVAECNSVEGQAAIEYLAKTHQRWAAQAAQIELDARGLERCTDVEAISHAHSSLAAGELTGPVSALLRSLSRISQDVDAALRQQSAYNQRLALSAVEEQMDGLLRELTRSSERYAVRFRPIADYWRRLVADQVRKLAATVELRQEIDSPYIIGMPLTKQQEIFIGRTDISARIEQLLLDRSSPPLFLYGQRRMGKTSLLNNLGRLLPSSIIPLFVDLQGPASRASDHAGFLYNIARGIVDSARRQRSLELFPLTREALAADPFTEFDEWLDKVEQALGDHTALLTFDEFEVLYGALVEGRFSETAVLGMLRHLIQHRPCFKVLLAGSHTLDELQRWASYLINLQVLHISYLSESEAYQLIERPVKDFVMRYEPDASQRVVKLTRRHPFLLQLLCAEIVALKNEQAPAVRRMVCLSDVEAAAVEALKQGRFFFYDIELNQVDAAGVVLLRFLAAQGEGAVVNRKVLARHFLNKLDQTLTLLTRRELIEANEEGYCFQVELIRRWFA